MQLLVYNNILFYIQIIKMSLFVLSYELKYVFRRLFLIEEHC